MEIKNKKIWQHAAGDTDRNYVDICLKWDVILNGPGYAGKLPECKIKLLADGWKSRKITGLLRFSEEMHDGDIVVLRLGTTDVHGVGVIVGNYEWLEQFSDVDGWDLQHVRRVRWLWKNLEKPKTFPKYTLKLGDTTQELTSLAVKDWIKSIDVASEELERDTIQLPLESSEKVDFRKISENLFYQGISSNSIETLEADLYILSRV